MKHYLISFLFLITLACTAQDSNDYNVRKGVVIKGYDVVSYFEGKPEKGSSTFETSYNGVTWRFSSQANLDKFLQAPIDYVPQYGGYCAYAIGKKGEKVDIDPMTYEIRDGKLYLFYNAWGTNTLDLWNKEGPEDLRVKADQYWESMHKG